MRLLNIKTLRLESYPTAEEAPPYAILSHTWGEEEILYSDMVGKPHDEEFLELQARFDDLASRFDSLESRLNAKTPSTSYEESATRKYRKDPSILLEDTLLTRAKQKKGWIKVEGCCKEASRFGLDYVWIDTCCIYKEDSSELSEAINSMFAWYRKAALCFAYLSDACNMDDAFGSPNALIHDRIVSRWFSRGWTLQELIAPKTLIFYQQDWNPLGVRKYLVERIHLITKIPENVLRNGLHGDDTSNLSMATKISWSIGRKTARPEDGIYSLMGLFSVTMPIIYGEGKQSAFFRLQSEIFRASGDHSIFAWTVWPRSILTYPHSQALSHTSLLESDRSKDLIALNPRMFTPITESSVDLEEMSSFDIESSPYDAITLGIDNSSRVKHDLKYSAITHGMRVQLLIEETGLFTEDGQILLGHLACKMKYSTDIVGIYLILKHPGLYHRMEPRSLVCIGLEHHLKCRLSLEDVYITYPQPKAASQANLDIVTLMSSAFSVQHVELTDADLKKSGFMVTEWSECTKRVPEVGKILLVFDSRLAKEGDDLKTHTVSFKNLTLPDSDVMAVTWKVDEELHVCNQIHFGAGTTVARVQELSKTLSFTTYSPGGTWKKDNEITWLETHWVQRSGNGAGISVVLHYKAGKLMMKIIII